MSNFELQIRRDIQDIEGAVLSVNADNLVLDGTDVVTMTNLAKAVKPGSLQPRYQNPTQDTAANRPTFISILGFNFVRFERASSQFLDVLQNIDGIFSGIHEWTIGIAGIKGDDSSNSQAIIDLANLKIRRKNGSGDKSYSYIATEQGGTGDWVNGASIVIFNGATGGEWFENGSSDYSGSCSNLTPLDGIIGSIIGGTEYLDFGLSGLYLWKRVLSDFEIDFAFNQIDSFASSTTRVWATVTMEKWLDGTGNYSRINPNLTVPHRYYKVGVTSGDSEFIQISASVDGVVLPDTELYGDLFTYHWIEAPGSSAPVFREAGWSSIFDIRLFLEGHYVFQVNRQGGGAVLVHFDVELI